MTIEIIMIENVSAFKDQIIVFINFTKFDVENLSIYLVIYLNKIVHLIFRMIKYDLIVTTNLNNQFLIYEQCLINLNCNLISLFQTFKIYLKQYLENHKILLGFLKS